MPREKVQPRHLLRRPHLVSKQGGRGHQLKAGLSLFLGSDCEKRWAGPAENVKSYRRHLHLMGLRSPGHPSWAWNAATGSPWAHRARGDAWPSVRSGFVLVLDLSGLPLTCTLGLSEAFWYILKPCTSSQRQSKSSKIQVCAWYSFRGSVPL